MVKIQASVSKGWLNKHGGFVFPDQYYFDPMFRIKTGKNVDLPFRIVFIGLQCIL